VKRAFLTKLATVLLGSAGFLLSCNAQTPSARGGYLLPSGYLSTQGAQIVDSNGTPVRIASVGWAGTDGPAGSVLNGLGSASYKTILDSIKEDGFNTVRIPWSNVGLPAQPANTQKLGNIDFKLNSDLQGLTTLQIFQKIVAYCGQIGLKVIFDHHTDEGSWGQQPNGLWIDKGPGTDGTDGAHNVGTIDAAKFLEDWVMFAKTFAGNATVIGFDIDNEPTSVGHINWGKGGPTDILAMYETVGNAIQAVNPDALIIVEGPQSYSLPSADSGMDPTIPAPAGDLTAVISNPVVLNIPNKVLYSVHEYPKEISDWAIDSGPNFVAQMNKAWGFLVAQNIAPVWIGEMGSSMTLADSQAWAATLLPYMNGQYADQGGPAFTGNQQPVSGSWWLAGDETGEPPDGIQSAWGLGNYRPEQQCITDQMLFRPAGVTPAAPLTLYAYLMQTRTSGTIQWVATLRLGFDGLIANGVSFPRSKVYEFTIKAYGSRAGGAWPNMAVRIDGTTMKNLSVHTSNLSTYTAKLSVSKGYHQVAIAFTNDYHGGPTQDRNLYVYSLGIQ
jgi:aryl-phospho-beta-D-glucosidase BglC (GH1 family)